MKKIVVCLDIKNGKTSKGVQFENVTELGDPVVMAEDYCKQGADEIVIYDITASSEGRTADPQLVKAVRKAVNKPFMVGGGLATVEDIQKMIDLGVDKLSINTPAIKDKSFIAKAAHKFGSKAIALGIDVKKDLLMPSGYRIMTAGGRQNTDLDAVEWVVSQEQAGAGEVIVNSIDADGTRKGYDCELTALIKRNVKIPVVASGGAGSKEDILEMFTKTDADSALIASIAHFQIVTVPDIKAFLQKNGITI